MKHECHENKQHHDNNSKIKFFNLYLNELQRKRLKSSVNSVMILSNVEFPEAK